MAVRTVGVVIGRFQMLTQGHKALIEQVGKRSDTVVILVGISQIDGLCAENPLSFAQRHDVLGRSYPNAVILPVYNMATHPEWTAQVDNILDGLFPGDDITLYHGRDSFVGMYTGMYPTVAMEFPHPYPSATAIRVGIKESFEASFIQGQVYALNRQFLHVYPTVDVAIMNGRHCLFIQRADNSQWGFIGGFVDPEDPSLEVAAAREANEEVGISLFTTPCYYVASMLVNDWRYRGRDRIMTSLFRFKLGMELEPRPNKSEVRATKWATLGEARNFISPTHQPLLERLNATTD